MKKICIILVLLMGLFLIEGCENKEVEEPKKEEEIKLADDEVKLEGILYKLDQDDEGYNIKYKVASNFRKSTMINAINYFSEKIDDQEYFVFRILHYKNKTIDEAIKDSAESYDAKYETQIGDLDYTVVHFKNFAEADVNIYYHKNKKEVYAYVFTGRIDLTRLVEIFLKSVVYK